MVPTVTKFFGDNTTQVDIGGLTLYFSYETCVAFRHNGNLVVFKNVWSKTTAKHIGQIPGAKKVEPVEHDEFVFHLEEVCKNI